MTSYNWESYEPKIKNKKKNPENRSVRDEVEKLKNIGTVWNVKWYAH